LASRIALRRILSRYAAVSPAAWRFSLGEFGRPRVADGLLDRPIHFNLSHGEGWVVCAVSLAHERIGADVESLDPRADIEMIAEDHFTDDERRTAATIVEESDHRRYLLACWCLKESHLKALGTGLTLPLDQASFALDESTIKTTLGESWRFTLLALGSGHVVAVSAETDGAPLALRSARLSD
jgi:4'-phosphopantetheinyl transferase